MHCLRLVAMCGGRTTLGLTWANRPAAVAGQTASLGVLSYNSATRVLSTQTINSTTVLNALNANLQTTNTASQTLSYFLSFTCSPSTTLFSYAYIVGGLSANAVPNQTPRYL
jgi:hypothetical protein